jgi:hypothetical protein
MVTIDKMRDENGVITLSQIERKSPITANAEAWDVNDLACCSIAEIRLIALDVTTPIQPPLHRERGSPQFSAVPLTRRSTAAKDAPFPSDASTSI